MERDPEELIKALVHGVCCFAGMEKMSYFLIPLMSPFVSPVFGALRIP